MGAPGGARRRARAAVETGAGAGRFPRAPGARRLALLAVVARGGGTAHGSRPVGTRARALCRAVSCDARARHLPATVRLRDLLPVTRAQQCRSHALRAGAARGAGGSRMKAARVFQLTALLLVAVSVVRSEEHTSELQSRRDLVCRLLLEKKKTSVPIRPARKSRTRALSASANCESAWTCYGSG